MRVLKNLIQGFQSLSCKQKMVAVLSWLVVLIMAYAVFGGTLHRDTIPENLPSPNKEIIEVVPGIQGTKGLLLVSIKADIRDPDIIAKRIAVETHGIVYDRLKGLPLYSLYYEGAVGDKLNDLIKIISNYKEVDSVVPDAIVHPLKIPNDSEYQTETWDEDSPQGMNWGLEEIKALSAWDVTTGTKKVTIGIIDTGMPKRHGDLGNISKAVVYENSTSTHGTHVAGIIAATGNNHRGITGVCWNCRIVFYGWDNAKTLREILIYTQKSIMSGAKIINLSYAHGDWANDPDFVITEDIKARIRTLNSLYSNFFNAYADVLFVIASGNESRDVKYATPASAVALSKENVISVASIDKDSSLSSFSNRGSLVSIAAPGSNIVSTFPCEKKIFGLYCTDRYGVLSGTSMAAPYVTGVAGLVLSAHPEYSAAQVKDCIIKSSNSRTVSSQSFGIVDAKAAVVCGGVVEVPRVAKVVASKVSSKPDFDYERNDALATSILDYTNDLIRLYPKFQPITGEWLPILDMSSDEFKKFAIEYNGAYVHSRLMSNQVVCGKVTFSVKLGGDSTGVTFCNFLEEFDFERFKINWNEVGDWRNNYGKNDSLAREIFNRNKQVIQAHLNLLKSVSATYSKSSFDKDVELFRGAISYMEANLQNVHCSSVSFLITSGGGEESFCNYLNEISLSEYKSDVTNLIDTRTQNDLLKSIAHNYAGLYFLKSANRHNSKFRTGGFAVNPLYTDTWLEFENSINEYNRMYSELNSLLPSLECTRASDRIRINEYFSFDFVPTTDVAHSISACDLILSYMPTKNWQLNSFEELKKLRLNTRAYSYQQGLIWGDFLNIHKPDEIGITEEEKNLSVQCEFVDKEFLSAFSGPSEDPCGVGFK